MSIYKKILEVMKDVEYLQKDDQVAFGNTKYKAISEEKVTSTIRASLVKNGIVIIPVKQEHRRVDNLSTVDVTYKIVDVDTGDFIEAVSSGTGADTQDKGVGKAMTYAYKYLLLRTFAIPTGDDPDKISSAELDAQQNKPGHSIKKQLETKWEALAGNKDGFSSWYTKQINQKVTEQSMMEYLTQKLIEKKKGA